MTERPNVPVLKTGVGFPTVGSNPTPSATRSKSEPYSGVFVRISTISSFLVGASLLGTLALPATAQAASPSALHVAVAARNYAEGQVSVHEVAVLKSPVSPNANYTSVNDVSRVGAREVVTGTATNHLFFTLVALATQRVVYVKASAVALENFLLGLTPGVAVHDAERWLAVYSSAGTYPTLAASTTIASDFSLNLYVAGTANFVGHSVIAGIPVQVIHLVSKATSHTPALHEYLYLTEGPHPLPVREVASGSGVTLTVTWTKWGERVPLTPQVPFATFR